MLIPPSLRRCLVAAATLCSISECLSPQVPLDKASVPIAPYLVGLDESSATIGWVTSEEVRGEVVLLSYGDRAVYRDDHASSYHRVVLDGLQPGHRYRYEIGNVYSGHFTTATPDPAFQVVVFGHPGGTEAYNQYPIGSQAARILALNPDFVLCTGDITYYATVAQFARHFFRRFASILSEKPIYVSPGNHDAAWPMLHGVNYSVFRQLFPFDYAADTGAYYSFVYKNTKFLALSYVPEDNASFSQQMKWLSSELNSSTEDFNIVFLGGAQEGYYDKDLLFETLARSRVDMVFGGDGAGTFQDRIAGVDYFFAGTSISPQMYYLEFEKYRMAIRLLDVAGGEVKKTWHFYTSAPKEPIQSLMKNLVPSATDSANPRMRFTDLGASSSQFDGVRLVIDGPEHRNLGFRIRWAPATDDPLAGERYYREQVLMLVADERNTFSIPLPTLAPLKAEPYSLAEINLTLDTPMEGFSLRTSLVDAYLFRDSDR